jgi:hypothetical protein
MPIVHPLTALNTIPVQPKTPNKWLAGPTNESTHILTESNPQRTNLLCDDARLAPPAFVLNRMIAGTTVLTDGGQPKA